MKKSILTLIALLTFALSLNAETLKHSKGRMQVWIPDNWVVEHEDEDSFEAYDKNEEVFIYFEMLDSDDVEQALNNLEEELSGEIKNLKEVSSEEISLNGLNGFNIDAEGSYEGKPVSLSILLLKTNVPHKILLLNGMVYKNKLDAHLPVLSKILKSVKSF